VGNTLTREELLAALHEGEISFSFTKTDGTVREMRATLSPTLVPPSPVKESTVERKPNTDPNLFKVWDLDAKGWRSFRFDRLI
jgi:hypothetical protein